MPVVFSQEGGIETYSRTLIQALRQVRPHQPLRVFSRNDHPRHLPTEPTPGIGWHGASGSPVRLALALLEAARRERPRLLLSTHPNFAPLQALHQQLHGTPSWCSAHGIEVWALKPGLKRLALTRLHRLLPVSRFTAERLRQQLGSSCPPLELLPNSFDAARFTPGPRPNTLLERYGLHPEQPLILSLSRLNRADSYKHLDRLIEALPSLLPRWPDLRLLIAGEGDDRPRLQRHAAQLGLKNQVIFPGRVASSELADYYRLASVFALPSGGEGFGIVFLEALGCGVPVLAGNRDGSVDPLRDGRFGLLADPELPLAPALAALLAHKGEDLWFCPQELASQARHAFGFDSFCRALDAQLTSLEEA